MPSMPAFPALDLSNFDLSQVKLPQVKFSDMKFPEIKFPDVKVPEFDVERATDLARDAAYVGVGLTVLAIQQSQVRRREVQATVERGVRAVADRVR